MMMGEAEESGEEYAQLHKSVIIKNGSSATRSVDFVLWDESVLLRSYNSNIASGSTKTITNFATDGTHIWAYVACTTTVSYNGSAATFVRSGQYYMLTIPEDYDESIPFIFS